MRYRVYNDVAKATDESSPALVQQTVFESFVRAQEHMGLECSSSSSDRLESQSAVSAIKQYPEKYTKITLRNKQL